MGTLPFRIAARACSRRRASSGMASLPLRCRQEADRENSMGRSGRLAVSGCYGRARHHARRGCPFELYFPSYETSRYNTRPPRRAPAIADRKPITSSQNQDDMRPASTCTATAVATGPKPKFNPYLRSDCESGRL